MDMFSIFAIFAFRPFSERQGSHRAENLTADRSRAPRYFVLCMWEASAAKKSKQRNNIEKKSRKCPRISSVNCMAMAIATAMAMAMAIAMALAMATSTAMAMASFTQVNGVS